MNRPDINQSTDLSININININTYSYQYQYIDIDNGSGSGRKMVQHNFRLHCSETPQEIQQWKCTDMPARNRYLSVVQ